MSNIISKIRQRIALKDKNKFDLSCDHITTTDFFHISPVYFKEMVPGEKIKINQLTFTRLAPLVNPMLGRARITNRAFFVPMRTIFKGWNEFITDVPVDGKFLSVPLLQPEVIADAFRNPVLATELVPQGSATVGDNEYDFGYTDSSNNAKYYRLSERGRKAWKIMTSLGYRMPLGYYSANTSSQGDEFSALPILAYAKIFKDWYQNQAYTTNVFDLIFEISKLANGVPYMTATLLLDILNYCTTATYDKDYFTSAWDRPVSPNNGLMSANTITDISNDSTAQNRSIVNNVTSATIYSPTSPAIKGVSSSSGSPSGDIQTRNITQYAIDALKSLTDYLKRHQIAGGLAMDRMMARFGMKPSDAALDRSIYLGKDEVNVQIADVMATAAGATAPSVSGSGTAASKLGEYAGKGLGYSDNGWFEYSTEEYGYFIIISVLQPHVGYVQGCSRYNLHTSRLDFFTPEFDALGVQAIARKELMSDYSTKGASDNLATLTPAAALNGVFGYTSRYAEYKTQQDNLTGDFTLNTRNVGLDSWHLNRMIPEGSTLTLPEISHNFAFVEGETDQYDRIFAYRDGNGYTAYDHFYVIHHFNVEDYAPMSQLFDDYQFDGGSKQVNIEVNGTQLN